MLCRVTVWAKMLSAHKIELRIESPSGDKLFGSVVIGIPENQFLELIAKFPAVSFTGQNPKVNEAIKEGITKEERGRMAKDLGFPADTEPKFEFQGMLRYIDEARETPSFESSGRKFWIFPRKT
jgi:hypothetical protein